MKLNIFLIKILFIIFILLGCYQNNNIKIIHENDFLKTDYYNIYKILKDEKFNIIEFEFKSDEYYELTIKDVFECVRQYFLFRDSFKFKIINREYKDNNKIYLFYRKILSYDLDQSDSISYKLIIYDKINFKRYIKNNKLVNFENHFMEFYFIDTNNNLIKEEFKINFNNKYYDFKIRNILDSIFLIKYHSQKKIIKIKNLIVKNKNYRKFILLNSGTDITLK